MWYLSNTAVVCVKMTGTVMKNWNPTITTTDPVNDGDTTEDFAFDYVDHTITTVFGKDPRSMAADTDIRFSGVVVPFSTFKDNETSAGGVAPIEVIGAALALFYAAF